MILEIIGTLTLIISVYLATKNNIYNWIFSIINVICYFLIFYDKKLYAESVLQIYFIFNCIYGIIYWKDNNHKIKHLNKKYILLYSIVSIISIIITYLILLKINDAQYRLIDSIIFVFNIVGTIMLSRKIYENWYIWIFLNIISSFLYFKIELYLLSIVYFCFIGLNVYGLKQWKKLN